MSFFSHNRLVVLYGIGSRERQHRISELHALSLYSLRGEPVLEVDGWVWNNEVTLAANPGAKISPEQQKELARLLDDFQKFLKRFQDYLHTERLHIQLSWRREQHLLV